MPYYLGSPYLIGEVKDFAGSTIPTGFLECGGQAVNRTTYAALFAVIGTTYGVGDGSTTFNLPDLRGRVAAGKDNLGGTTASRLTSGGAGITGTTLGAAGGTQTHPLIVAEMPSHSHNTASGGQNVNPTGPGGGFLVEGGTNVIASTTSTGTAGGGGAHQNTQPTLILNKIIYAGV